MNSAFAIEVTPTLLAALKNGEEAAYAGLYRMFERPVHNLALRMTGSREDAFDVLQDTFLQLHARIGQFRGDAPFWSWLRRIAVNASLMKLRARSRDLHEPLDETFTEPSAGEGEGIPVWIDIERALASLPDRTRSVVWLHLVEGYGHDEIAALFGQSTSFSKSQLMRGVQRLRAWAQSHATEETSRHALA